MEKSMGQKFPSFNIQHRHNYVVLLFQMRHVKITAEHFVKTDHSRVVVEGLDSDDWMAVDLGTLIESVVKLDYLCMQV